MTLKELAERLGVEPFRMMYCPCGLQYPRLKPPPGWIARTKEEYDQAKSTDPRGKEDL